MTPIKSYIAEGLVGKRLHFKCDCLLHIDIVGVVKGWSEYSGEIIWEVLTEEGKMIKIGMNHPNMFIEEL